MFTDNNFYIVYDKDEDKPWQTDSISLLLIPICQVKNY